MNQKNHASALQSATSVFLPLALILVLGMALNPSLARAMSPTEEDSTRPSIGRSGELFTIQFAPASRSVTVGLAGKPAMTLDSSRVTIFGRVIPLKGETKQLKIVPVESHFEIVDEIQPNDPIEIEIKDKKSKKSEKFKIEHRQP